jgi:hypothetical protein
MRALGFASVPCGPDGPDAWVTAEEWNRRWDATRRGQAPSLAMAAADNLSPERSEELMVYPVRSLGEAFRRYRRIDEWARKAPRTREEWWRAWRRIKPVFSDCDPRTVTLEDVSAWHKAIEDTVSLREAHRCVKIWPSATLIRAWASVTRPPRADRRPGARAKWCASTSEHGGWPSRRSPR